MHKSTKIASFLVIFSLFFSACTAQAASPASSKPALVHKTVKKNTQKVKKKKTTAHTTIKLYGVPYAIKSKDVWKYTKNIDKETRESLEAQEEERERAELARVLNNQN